MPLLDGQVLVAQIAEVQLRDVELLQVEVPVEVQLL